MRPSSQYLPSGITCTVQKSRGAIDLRPMNKIYYYKHRVCDIHDVFILGSIHCLCTTARKLTSVDIASQDRCNGFYEGPTMVVWRSCDHDRSISTFRIHWPVVCNDTSSKDEDTKPQKVTLLERSMSPQITEQKSGFVAFQIEKE
jgi:hypothetical protein